MGGGRFKLALSHFCAAVVEQNTSICEYLDACTCLVQMQCTETDSKFHGKHRNTSLLPLVLAVELVNRSPPSFKVAFFSKLLEELRDVPVNIDLLVKRSIVPALIEVLYSQIIDRYAKPFSNGAHVAFSNEHGLRTTKASERGIAVGIRLADFAAYIDVRYFVAAK